MNNTSKEARKVSCVPFPSDFPCDVFGFTLFSAFALSFGI
jgi:hypothetical protein